MAAFKDLTGQTFNRLFVINEVLPRGATSIWLCKCTCGNTVAVRGSSLKSGNTQSCSCLAKEALAIRATKHGARQSKLYQIHSSMLTRCCNTKNKSYLSYGSKGITVCDDWKSFLNFREWAMNNGYQEGLSIDRVDNTQGYTPPNCRWVTQVIQVRNRTPFKNSTSKFIGVSWDRQYSKWTASVGVNYKVVHLGRFVDEVSAAKARDTYIINNKLEGFTLNFT